MFRRTLFKGAERYQPPAPPGAGAQAQTPLTISSPYSLLRLLLRSVDLKVKSGHARSFLRRRIIQEWRLNRHSPDPNLQRLQMERGGAMLAALHKPAEAGPGEPVHFDFSKQAGRSGKIADGTKSILRDDMKPAPTSSE